MPLFHLRASTSINHRRTRNTSTDTHPIPFPEIEPWDNHETNPSPQVKTIQIHIHMVANIPSHVYTIKDRIMRVAQKRLSSPPHPGPAHVNHHPAHPIPFPEIELETIHISRFLMPFFHLEGNHNTSIQHTTHIRTTVHIWIYIKSAQVRNQT